MIRLKAVALTIATCAIGCSDASKIKDAPVSVSGRASQGGKPIGNIAVWFHPLDQGHLKSLPVKSDGSFDGELVGGNYSYYVDKSSDPKSAAALKKIDPKYYQPDMGRSINVEFGKEIALAFD